MLTLIRTLIASLALALAAAACQAQDREVSAETIASYPHGAFLENIDVGPDGALLFTSYMDRSIFRWSNEGPPQRMVRLDVHPVAVLSRASDVIVSAHGASFADGPAFTATNQFLVLDRAGAVLRRTAAPESRFLNGLVELSPSTILAADSIAGRIWSFDPATGALASWLADPMFAPEPGQAAQRPGANGLKIRGGWLYISNSSRGALHRVRLGNDRPQGPIEIFATPGPIDDFTFLADGSIAAATHGAKLIWIGPDGRVTDILARGCDGCTSVASFGPNGDLIVLTTGNLLEGGPGPARVLRVASPVAR